MIALALFIVAVSLFLTGNLLGGFISIGLAVWAMNAKPTRRGRPWYRGG